MIIPIFEAVSERKIAVHHLTPNADINLPVVVMCHPTGFCGMCYASVACHLRDLNIFAIDMRCHGDSERANLGDWESFKLDIEAAFEQILIRTVNKLIFGVGISSGSSAHILNAANNDGLYAGLYLCEPILFPPGADLSNRQALAESARNRRSDFESREQAFNRFHSRGPLSKLNPSALALYCQHGFKDTNAGVTLACRPEDEESIYLSGGANGVYEALSKIECPTKIVYGELSDTYDEQRANLVATRVKNSDIEILADAGHFTLYERPYDGANGIKSFIDSIAV